LFVSNLSTCLAKPLIINDEYIRHRVAGIFIAEELTARKRRGSVKENLIRNEWAIFPSEIPFDVFIALYK
jgi:hypothetical protein